MGIPEILKKVFLIKCTCLLFQAMIIFLIGNLLYAGAATFDDDIDFLTDKLREASSGMSINIDTSEIELAVFLKPIGGLMISLGGLAGSVFSMGVLIIKLDNALFLVLYLALVALLFLFSVILTINFFTNRNAVVEYLQPSVEKSMEEYSGDYGTDSFSITFNAVMNGYECCGFNGHTDFKNLKHWRPKVNPEASYVTPRMCCKIKSKDRLCAQEGTASLDNNWGPKGCKYALSDMVRDQIFFIVFFTLFCLQLFTLIVVGCVIVVGSIIEL